MTTTIAINLLEVCSKYSIILNCQFLKHLLTRIYHLIKSLSMII